LGFSAGGVHCGLAKQPDKKDLALIVSEVPCAAAAIYTRNKVKASPLAVTKAHLADGTARAVICNSGNANACSADGEAVARGMCRAAAQALGISPRDVAVGSTGVIGQPLPLEKVAAAAPALKAALEDGWGGSDAAARAIMTTDLSKKELAISFVLGGKTCRLGGIAKGSGMIHPNMGTMLAFLTTDAAVSAPMLQKALRDVTEDTFNMVSVDGDTSTNDMCVVLANGLAGNPIVDAEGPALEDFTGALRAVCTHLAREMARDGEGATKLLTCTVEGAPDTRTARVLSKSVICSNLFKAAMFGADANWGRVLCALGYADADFDISRTGVCFASAAGSVEVCKDGAGVPFSEEQAKRVLGEKEIDIRVSLCQGGGSATAWGCDLTYDYVKINGDYRS